MTEETQNQSQMEEEIQPQDTPMETEVETIEIANESEIVETTTEPQTTETQLETTTTEPSPEPSTSETNETAPEPEPEKVPTPEPPKPKVNIIIKTPKETKTVSVDEDSKVADLKTIAAEKFQADPEYLCLIFSGKLMEDDETLETLNIKDGMTIHLIIKTAPKEPEPAPLRPPADISQTPFGLGAIGGLAGLESLGMGSANFMELQNRLQTELVSNPELLKRVLENPLVNSFMSDTATMKTLVQKNPQMRDLMHRHPEIRQMLNNTELLKQTAELAKNSNMLQELMRSVEGNDLEPTGFNSLPNVYTSFQTPRLSEAKEKLHQSQEKNEGEGIFNNAQMASLLQQMTENPRMIQNMLNAPYTQAMLQALAADPSMATALVNENPWYQGNPQLQNYAASMMPQMVTQLKNPEILNMMASPQAVNALMQIQDGMQQLQDAAPALIANIGLGPFGDFTATEPTGSPSEDAKPPEPQNIDSFSNFMGRMIKGMHEWDPKAPPEEKYKMQLDYMKMMGFDNEEKNLQMLIANFGDVNAVVQKLLMQNQKEYGLHIN